MLFVVVCGAVGVCILFDGFVLHLSVFVFVRLVVVCCGLVLRSLLSCSLR